jgi:hypothetical protein
MLTQSGEHGTELKSLPVNIKSPWRQVENFPHKHRGCVAYGLQIPRREFALLPSQSDQPDCIEFESKMK